MQKNHTKKAQMFIFAIIFTLTIIGAASAADNSSSNLVTASVDQATQNSSQTLTEQTQQDPNTSNDQATQNSSQTISGQTQQDPNTSNSQTTATTGPQCLIVFDDGNVAQYDIGFNYMQTKGIVGTAYVNGYNIGTDGVLTLADLKSMNAAGWIIGNHCYVHQNLLTLTNNQIIGNITENIQFLTNNGLPNGAYDLAYPGGFFDDNVMNIMASLNMQTGRTINPEPIADVGTINNLYELPGYVVYNTTSVSTIESYVQTAVTNNQTIIILFHNIADSSKGYDYNIQTNNFKTVINYIAASGINCINIDDLYQEAVHNYHTNIAVGTAEGNKGDVVTLMATLTDKYNKPVKGKTIQFNVGGTLVGTPVTTDVNGIAKLSYTITQTISGPYTILAKFIGDNRYAATSNTGTLQVDHTPTTIAVETAKGIKGDIVTLMATLTANNNPIIGDIQFSVDGTPVSTPITTDASGIATSKYTITQDSGTYQILAKFMGDKTYTATSGNNNLQVDHTPTTMVVNTAHGIKGSIVNLIATLTDNNKKAVSGTTIQFSVDGTPLGSAVTDLTGAATLQHTIIETLGTHTIQAQCADDSKYAGATNKNNLVVDPTPDTIPPKVYSTTIRNKATHVSKTSSIIIKFTESIKTSTSWTKIYVKNLNKNKKLKMSKKISGKTLTIKTTKRTSKTKYQVYIPAGAVKDLTGNKLKTHYSISFKTA